MTGLTSGLRRGILLLGALLLASPGVAQNTPTAKTARSVAGQVGQRQTREEAALNIEPAGRIASRVQNRVQSRVRNRIDGDYDPQANAASPFVIAGEQARVVGRPRRR